jgi:hypothetical protein
MLDTISEDARILHIDATGCLVKLDRQARDYGQILNYAFYLKNFNNLQSDGILINEVVSSRHDTGLIGEMFQKLKFNYKLIHKNKHLKFRLVVSDFSWPTIHAALEQLNNENIFQYMHRIYQIASGHKQ